MNEQRVIESFQNYLKEKGFEEKSLSLSILPNLFIDYYQDVKFDAFNEEDDGDMLLFQYGTYNFQEERYFQINFTRQFYEVYEDDSHQICQLGVTFFYCPKNFYDIISFNKWSANFSNLTDFHNVIIDSDGFKKALNEILLKKEIAVELVWRKIVGIWKRVCFNKNKLFFFAYFVCEKYV